MRKEWLEAVVGIFLVLGMLAFGWLALQLGEVDWLSRGKTWSLHAEFDNISGLTSGADVRVAGVVVGKVGRIWLGEFATAMISMELERGIEVSVDSIASVKSQGIIGDKFIQLSIGGDEKIFAAGETILDTESAVDIESLISKFVFGQVDEK